MPAFLFKKDTLLYLTIICLISTDFVYSDNRVRIPFFLALFPIFLSILINKGLPAIPRSILLVLCFSFVFGIVYPFFLYFTTYSWLAFAVYPTSVLYVLYFLSLSFIIAIIVSATFTRSSTRVIFKASLFIINFALISYPFGLLLPFHPFVDSYNKFPRLVGLVGEPSHLSVPFAIVIAYLITHRISPYFYLYVVLVSFLSFSPSLILVTAFIGLLMLCRTVYRNLISFFMRSSAPIRIKYTAIKTLILASILIAIIVTASGAVLTRIIKNLSELSSGNFHLLDPRISYTNRFLQEYVYPIVDFYGFGLFSETGISSILNNGFSFTFSSFSTSYIWLGRLGPLVVISSFLAICCRVIFNNYSQRDYLFYELSLAGIFFSSLFTFTGYYFLFLPLLIYCVYSIHRYSFSPSQ